MQSVIYILPPLVRLLSSSVGRAIGLKISFPQEEWVRAPLGEKTLLLSLRLGFTNKSDNGALAAEMLGGDF